MICDAFPGASRRGGEGKVKCILVRKQIVVYQYKSHCIVGLFFVRYYFCVKPEVCLLITKVTYKQILVDSLDAFLQLSKFPPPPLPPPPLHGFIPSLDIFLCQRYFSRTQSLSHRNSPCVEVLFLSLPRAGSIIYISCMTARIVTEIKLTCSRNSCMWRPGGQIACWIITRLTEFTATR